MKKRKEWLVRPSTKERIALYIAAVLTIAFSIYLFQRPGTESTVSGIVALVVAAVQLLVGKFGVPAWLCD